MKFIYHPTCCKFQQFTIENTDTVYSLSNTLPVTLRAIKNRGYTACLQGLVPADKKEIINYLVELGFYSSPKSFNMNNGNYFFMFLPIGEVK